jgi:predicted lactoylglutathione lyase
MYQNGFQDPEGHVWELVHLSGPAPVEGAGVPS